jgi:hypothetical protein
MKITISYSKEADKFLKKNKGNISEDEVDALEKGGTAPGLFLPASP